MRKNVLIITVIVLWISALGAGFSKLYDYEFKAGDRSHPSQQWPKAFAIKKDHGYQLVMLAHPHCPCTRASLGELELIMSRLQGKVNAYVLFVKPKQFNQGWVETDLFKHAREISGVQVMVDDEGKLAKLFGGTTSGQTFLYDPQGHLVFSGGITDSRGHSGDNVGRSTIVALIQQKPVGAHSTKFFGCLLNDRPNKDVQNKG